MSDDVMSRLAAVQPMPRGERLALCYGADRYPPRRAWDLLFRSRTLSALAEAIEQDEPRFGATALWREYAAPLRKCREELQGLKNAGRLNHSLMDILEKENILLRAELQRIPPASRAAAVLDEGEP